MNGFRRKVPMQPKPCPTGKRRHRTRNEAAAAMRTLLAFITHDPNRGTPNVFKCGRCGNWHWGHLRPEREVG